jgi:hypothetical protein
METPPKPKRSRFDLIIDILTIAFVIIIASPIVLPIVLLYITWVIVYILGYGQ